MPVACVGLFQCSGEVEILLEGGPGGLGYVDRGWGVRGGDLDVGANKVGCFRANCGGVVGAVPGDWECGGCSVLFVELEAEGRGCGECVDLGDLSNPELVCRA